MSRFLLPQTTGSGRLANKISRDRPRALMKTNEHDKSA